MPTPTIRFYTIGESRIPVAITRKRVRNLRLRYKDGAASATLPYGVDPSFAERFIARALQRLSAKEGRREPPTHDGGTHVLGKYIQDSREETEILSSFVKEAKPLFEERLRYYEGLMGIEEPYKLRVKTLKTLYGVNSKKTHAITLGSVLYHYALPIIDSVVVHELAHHFVRNHSQAFYDVVLRYCPDYRKQHKKLREQIYE